jgi:hypothetical protein
MSYGPQPYKIPRGASIGISIEGLPEVQRLFDRLGDTKETEKVMLKATDAAARTVVKPAVLSEMPPNRKPGNAKHQAGDLRRSVWVHRAKRKYGMVGTLVTNHRKIAFWWPMVIGGSRAHRIRFPNQVAAGVQRSDLKYGTRGDGDIQHPGHGANDFLGRAFAKSQAPALAKINDAIGRYIDRLVADQAA